MADDKTKQLVAKLESHLRKTARQLVCFDTLEETLSYLLESFGKELTCDFVGIFLKEQEYLIPKKWIGATPHIEEQLTMPVEEVSADLLKKTRWWQRENLNLENECSFIISLLQQDLSTWFTVPLYDDHYQKSFGFCVIGFRQFVPIIMELEQNFIEFGKDVAVALNLAIEKERQKQKIKGIEWLRKNTFDGSSLNQLIEKITGQAGRGTHAQTAMIYLFDETQNQFVFTPPAYGQSNLPHTICVDSNNNISNYFPLLERTGGSETVVPLVVNLKTIGVLYVQKKPGDVITEEDLELLQFLSSHVSAIIENARLYTIQLEEKERLRTFLDHHQKLVKQTVEGEGFEGITSTIHEILNKPVVLTDRFLKMISHSGLDEAQAEAVLSQIKLYESELARAKNGETWIPLDVGSENGEQVFTGVWPVMGGGDLLGYLVTSTTEKRLTRNTRVTMDYALNICAIQFIKRKIVMDTYDQLKDNFINHFLENHNIDQHTLMEYSNLLKWNFTDYHCVAVLYIELGCEKDDQVNVLNLEAQKSFIWDKIKDRLSVDFKEMLFTRKKHHFVLIVPAKYLRSNEGFWQDLYSYLTNVVKNEDTYAKVYLGIGEETNELEGYPKSFKQAVHAVNVVRRRFKESGFSIFNQLGAYTVLYNHQSAVDQLFIDRYLTPLLNYNGHKGVDLVHTLRVYLENNGNLKKTAEDLYIHRSTLQYRLERIAHILDINLEDAEETFNLMLALKLYDLQNSSVSE